MAALSLSIDVQRPMNRWDHDRISPGVVGSVGDVIINPRFAQSTPDMRMRYDPYFSGKNSVDKGANVQDGGRVGYSSGGAQARTVDSNWGGRRNFKVRNGWIIQDMRAPEKLVTPYLGSTGDYTWQNKIATNYEARTTGTQFMPLPGGYNQHPGEINRGGSGPRVTDVAGGDFDPNNNVVDGRKSANDDDLPGIFNPETGAVTGGRRKQTLGGLLGKAFDAQFGVKNYGPGLGKKT